MAICSECNQNQIANSGDYCQECLSATKKCRRCSKKKSIFDFEKNQKSIAGRVSRRGECKECRKSKKPIPAKQKKEYEQKNPPPEIGGIFICPICDTIFERQFTNDVVLDHNHDTGEIRGYICRMCNNGMGMMEDSPTILQRAIQWLKGTLR